MAFGLNSFFKTRKEITTEEMRLEYAQTKGKTGFVITYTQNPEGLVTVAAISTDSPSIEMSFPSTATDEAHIMYRQACELLRTRAAIDQDRATIKSAVEKLFSYYHPK
jgi:hypothetical protein